MKVAAIQMQMQASSQRNIKQAKQMVVEAASHGANVIVLPELFCERYFCMEKDAKHFQKAHTLESDPAINAFKKIAQTLEVVLPISYFEVDANGKYFNAVAVIDADGAILGNYRKTHIPDGPGYEEKFYFQPGNSGFMVHETRFGKIGVGICWDQWFSESARCMALLGAEILIYPTAIGSEPEIGGDSKNHWQRVQQGHAAANMVPLVAANRFGEESTAHCLVTFYGSSFVCDEEGEIVSHASHNSEAIIYATFNLAAIAQKREYWGLFRDRRAEGYAEICKI